MEKTAAFHGLSNFSMCLKHSEHDQESDFYARMINVLNHGDYSLFEPHEMSESDKQYFKEILQNFTKNSWFDHELFQN